MSYIEEGFLDMVKYVAEFDPDKWKKYTSSQIYKRFVELKSKEVKVGDEIAIPDLNLEGNGTMIVTHIDKYCFRGVDKEGYVYNVSNKVDYYKTNKHYDLPFITGEEE